MSYYAPYRRLGFLNGMRIEYAEISMAHNIDEMFLYDSSYPVFVPRRYETELETDILVSGEDIDFVMRLVNTIMGLRGGQLFHLGNGRVCPYCGDYNPVGLLTCWRCGGKTNIEPHISINAWPFYLTQYSLNWAPMLYASDTARLIRLSWIAYEQVTNEHLDLLASSDTRLESIPFSHGLLGYYLCQYCGQTVEEGKICPNCGGTRLPFSELMKIDHECLYCGRKVYGSIVCPGCAATLAGITYRELRGKQ